MQHTLTQNDLVRYLYGETSPGENVAIRRNLDTDADLHAQYERLRTAMDALGSLSLSPRASTVADLLRYSRSSAPVATTR